MMCTDVIYMDMQGQVEQKVMDVIQLMIPVKRTQGRLVKILSAKQMSALIQENKLLKSQQGDQVQGLAAQLQEKDAKIRELEEQLAAGNPQAQASSEAAVHDPVETV